ncbi:MAG: PEP-CTERM sorting domain-containing protein [Alcanivoracaceae bacterium]|nr:PEP-CTERM sorting domain-containing protein [Alcanivoracaceae bacterium]
MFKFFIVILTFISFSANANLITYNTENELKYISYQSEDFGSYDLVWASAYNVQFVGFGCFGVESDEQYLNELYSPLPAGCNQLLSATQVVDYNDWGYYSDLSLQVDMNEFLESIYRDIYGNVPVSLLISNIFKDGNGQFDSFSIWNTSLINGNTVSGKSREEAVSNWTDPLLDTVTFSQTSTVYFRKSKIQPVPEPSTLLIFSLGLIALASRKKIFN